MPATTEKAGGRRLALVVATESYTDPTLAKLRAPGRDASDLAAVLGDSAVGGFEVAMVLDAPAEALRRRIARFCAQVGPGDLALVYLSCHGVLDDRGRLYYASVDTDRALLSATAVPSAWLNEQLEDCRSRRQILVLDCCHSGAFAKGAKGESSLALRERFEGRGRVVLTGSRGTEYSFERDGVVGDGISSLFTSALVEGLRSGDADRDGDGLVTVSELYDYAFDAVRATEARQTPTLWTYGAEGGLLVAHSPRGAIVEPAPLPEDLVLLLESARSRVREGAVTELAELLEGPDGGRALTARVELERIAAEDLPGVAAAARAALDGADESGRTGEPRPEEPAPPSTSPPAARIPPPPPPPTEPPPPAGQPQGRRRTVAIGAVLAVVATIVAAIALMGGGGERPFAATVLAVGGSPRGIAVGEGATWVSRYDDGKVTRIDPSSGTESIAVGPRPGKIAAGEGSVWVSFDDGRRLARIEPATRKVTRRTVVDVSGCDCAITELAIARGTLWAGSANRRAITKFDLETGEQLGEPYPPGPGFDGVFTVGDDAVWAVATDDHSPPVSWVVRVDPASGAIERIRLRTGSYFNGVAYGEETVWIADAANARNVVTAFDPATESEAANIKVPSGITADDIATTGSAVLVWDPVEGFLTHIDANEMRVVERKRVAGYQTRESVNGEWSDLAVDGELSWVTDPANDAVYKIDY